jgi:CheY-like chemotaxis protein
MPHAPTSEQVRVLVVDDVSMHREITGAMLTAGGFGHTCVKTAAEAIAAIKNQEFDLILMDVRMPGVDGLEATRLIRTLEGPHGQVAIVAVTAQDSPEQLAKCREAGMDSFLAKPFDPEALYAAVGAACLTSRRATVSSKAWRATMPVAVMLGADLPVLDFTMPERIVAALEPSAFQQFENQCWAVLGDLRELDDAPRPSEALVQAVHMLAGQAGTFGLERLAFVARHFVLAIENASAETATLAGNLRAAVKATLREMHDYASAFPDAPLMSQKLQPSFSAIWRPTAALSALIRSRRAARAASDANCRG